MAFGDNIQFSKKSGGDFLKLKDGNNKMRIVTEPTQVNFYFAEAVDGKKKRINCVDRIEAMDDAGEDYQQKCAVKVIDRTDGSIKFFEFGQAGIINGIRSLETDDDWGNPMDYDINIVKTVNSGKTEYRVIGSKHVALTADEKNKLKESKSFEEIYPIHTFDQIREMNLKNVVPF